MKKTKKILLTLLFSLFAFFPFLTGCQYTTQLSTPEITLFADDDCISWQSVAGTNTYDIYCNAKLLESYEVEENTKTVLYDYSESLTEDGKYQFYVVAVSNSLYLKDSESSNVVEVNFTKSTAPVPPPVEENERDIEFNVTPAGEVSYTPVSTDAEYTMYLYSNTTGLQSYPMTSNIVNLNGSKYVPNHEIYAIRVGYELNDETFISSTMKYYNPDNCAGYTDKIYIFDGLINDYYITSMAELKNIMYYTYIDRIEDFNIKISDNMKDYVANGFDGSYMVDKMNFAVDAAIHSYYETQSYVANNINNGYCKQLTNANEYNVKVSYFGVKECDITILPNTNSIYTQVENSGYYDRVDYDMLGDSYNNFVSDHYFLSTTCSTSEQLYWAVENKITPVVVSGSRAEIIYNKAKDVLRDIISEEMTDYEKTLSIFDWISINTNYDYTDYDAMYRGNLALGSVPTYLPCFYLEGVFITGYSVCDGFSKAYSLMCNMLGIDTIRIVGMANTNGQEGGHAWNKVFVDKDGQGGEDGQYYLVDITWTEILSDKDMYTTNEVSSHLYFLLGDNDVKDTHKQFNRSKFAKYSAPENFYYYNTDTFTYFDRTESTNKKYNWVIESNEEMQDLFMYTMDNSLSSVEFVADIDYMISYYEYINGENSYRSTGEIVKDYYVGGQLKSEYNPATDALHAYSYIGGIRYTETHEYYELRKNFIECMRGLKFKTQYFTITNYDGEVVYDENGNMGILYILEHNMCFDEKGEEELLVTYLDNANILGEYYLYVDNSMFTGISGNTYKAKLINLFAGVVNEKTMTLSVEYVGVSDDMQKFRIKILTNI